MNTKTIWPVLLAFLLILPILACRVDSSSEGSGATSRVGAADAVLKLLPKNVSRIQVAAADAITGGSVPESMADLFERTWNNYSLGGEDEIVTVDDVGEVVWAFSPDGGIVMLGGSRIDFASIGQWLDDEDTNIGKTSYQGQEMWGNDFVAMVVMQSDGYLVFGDTNAVKELLKVKARGDGSLAGDSENSLKNAYEDAASGWYVSASSNCDELFPDLRSCEAYSITGSRGEEDYLVNVTWRFTFRNEQRAELQSLDIEDWVEDRNYAWDIEEVKADGVSVEAKMSGDEEDFSTRWIGTDNIYTPPTLPTAVPEPESRNTTQSGTAPTSAPQPTQAPIATPVPRPTVGPTSRAAPEPTTAPEARNQPATLREYAAMASGGPGAIYVGDLTQLVGPAPHAPNSRYGLGDSNGMVPLSALENHTWIYESDYYQSLLDKAKLTNPTPLSYHEQEITIQFACINNPLYLCSLLQDYLAPNLAARTNGRLTLEVSSFPELGLAEPDSLGLIRDGTLSAATIYGGYAAGEVPQLDIQNLWGIYSSHEQEFEGNQAIIKDIEELVTNETGGGVIMNHSWYPGNAPFLFCQELISTPSDFSGKKIRSHGIALSDWINGMGAYAQFFAFAEVYTALERGIVDCGVTSADSAYGQRWYEVTVHMIGPLPSFPFHNNVINADVWQQIPFDLQQILLEEAAKSELEALRLAAIQNVIGLQRNIDAGMEHVFFSDEMNSLSRQVAINSVIPNWVSRAGGPNHPFVANAFNQRLGSVVGILIHADGTVVVSGF